jgi:hypothetical protein
MSGGNNRTEEKNVYNLGKLEIREKIEKQAKENKSIAKIIVYTMGENYYITYSAAKSLQITDLSKNVSFDGKLLVKLNAEEHDFLIKVSQIAIEYREILFDEKFAEKNESDYRDKKILSTVGKVINKR